MNKQPLHCYHYLGQVKTAEEDWSVSRDYVPVQSFHFSLQHNAEIYSTIHEVRLSKILDCQNLVKPQHSGTAGCGYQRHIPSNVTSLWRHYL
jgi:hypothetical protein